MAESKLETESKLIDLIHSVDDEGKSSCDDEDSKTKKKNLMGLRETVHRSKYSQSWFNPIFYK